MEMIDEKKKRGIFIAGICNTYYVFFSFYEWLILEII